MLGKRTWNLYPETMNVATYLRRRAEALAHAPVLRLRCHHCLQPDFSCYCRWLKPFDPGLEFVILMHPIEQRRRIATGRMSHLNLRHSHLIVGHHLGENAQLNALLADPTRHCVMLYPGKKSTNLSTLSLEQRFDWIPAGKTLTVLVIDGTWATARQMVNQSPNLSDGVARVCFTPPTPSNFRVRQQPRVDCYSTIEAIHHTIELLGPACGFPVHAREHDSLLQVFDNMVARQIDLANAHPDFTMPGRRKAL
jgi:DTW domain-containing protein YfiP